MRFKLFAHVFWSCSVFACCGGGCFSTMVGQLFRWPGGGRDSYALICMCTHARISTERERGRVMWYSTPKEIAPLELHIAILLPFYLTVMEITYCPLNRGCWLYYSNTVCTKCGLAKVLTGFLVHRCTVTVTSNVAQGLARSRQTLSLVCIFHALPISLSKSHLYWIQNHIRK